MPRPRKITAKVDMENIYSRQSGGWQVKISYGWDKQAGKFAHRLSKMFPPGDAGLAAARTWRNARKAELAGDDYVDQTARKGTTLREAIIHYRDNVAVPHAARKGQRDEISILNVWLEEAWLVDMPIVSIKPGHINKWIESQRRERTKPTKSHKPENTDNVRIVKPARPTTINNKLGKLSRVFQHVHNSVDFEFGIENPLEKIKYEPLDPPRRVNITDADENAILRACEARGPAWLPLMVKLVLATGMRQQEVRNLRWENVGQFKKNTIHIAKAKVTRRGEKPRKRDTIISLECRRVLSEIREVLGLSNHGFIFPDPAGLTCSAVQNYYQKAIVLAVEECNLSEKLTFHDLRHVAITKMANIFKKDPLKLAKSAGHSDIRMFFDVYYNPDMADAAADYQQAELQRMRELEGIKDIDAEIAETQKRMSDLLTLKTKLMN